MTRGKLAAAVADALTASPAFAETVVPLALEKLDGGGEQEAMERDGGDGKEEEDKEKESAETAADAQRVLSSLAASPWGSEALRPHVPRIWAALLRQVVAAVREQEGEEEEEEESDDEETREGRRSTQRAAVLRSQARAAAEAPAESRAAESWLPHRLGCVLPQCW